MGYTQMRLLAEFPAGTLRNATTASNMNLVATSLRVMPGVGKPFLIFAALPGLVAQVDFDMYPDYKVSNDVAQNIALIQAMLDNPPTDALTFA